MFSLVQISKPKIRYSTFDRPLLKHVPRSPDKEYLGWAQGNHAGRGFVQYHTGTAKGSKIAMADGKRVVNFSFKPPYRCAVAFHLDGVRAALAFDSSVLLVDLAAKKVLSRFERKEKSQADTMVFGAEGQLLIQSGDWFRAYTMGDKWRVAWKRRAVGKLLPTGSEGLFGLCLDGMVLWNVARTDGPVVVARQVEPSAEAAWHDGAGRTFLSQRTFGGGVLYEVRGGADIVEAASRAKLSADLEGAAIRNLPRLTLDRDVALKTAKRAGAASAKERAPGKAKPLSAAAKMKAAEAAKKKKAADAAKKKKAAAKYKAALALQRKRTAAAKKKLKKAAAAAAKKKRSKR